MYVYEATENGQTVVTCSTTTRCTEPQHKSLLLAEVLSCDRALSYPFISFLHSISSFLLFG